MTRTSFRRTVGIVRRVRLVAVILGLSPVLAGAGAGAQEAPTVAVRDFGVIPEWISPMLVVGMEPVVDELGLTAAQRDEQKALRERCARKLEQARSDIKDRARFREARAVILEETEAAVGATLTPEQRARLEQILIQIEGPVAFNLPAFAAATGSSLAARLKLSDDQEQRVRTIAAEGQTEIENAASFVIPLDTKQGPPTLEAIRTLVDSPQFQEAKQNARQAALDARAAVTRRIEEALADAQRGEYRALRGAPFDVTTLGADVRHAREFEVRQVAAAFGLGGGGGQRADPTFDTKVARPAYASDARHPRVLFDEAHHNFHTAAGRYKPFAELIASDGYEVIRNPETFSVAMLRKGDLLVIANALGSDRMGQSEAGKAAFTDAECDAVRDWVQEGGSLLFITDHAPFGAAAECLAKRLDVAINKGATSDPKHSEGDDTSLVFTRENHLLGDHPITRGRDDSERVNRVQTFTGTSIKGPEGSSPILKLADTAIDNAFGDGPPISAAGRAQGIAFTLGKGRVVVLGEAAELSAQVVGLDEKFGMNVPGLDNRQMALNILHWLSGLLEPGEASP